MGAARQESGASRWERGRAAPGWDLKSGVRGKLWGAGNTWRGSETPRGRGGDSRGAWVRDLRRVRCSVGGATPAGGGGGEERPRVILGTLRQKTRVRQSCVALGYLVTPASVS